MKTFVIVLAVSASTLISCGGAPSTIKSDASQYEHGQSRLNPADPESGEQNSANDRDTRRKIRVSATVDIKSADPDTVHARVMDVAWSRDGYVLASAANSTSIRLPADQFEDALREIESFGIVVNRKVFGEDVTEEYRDLTTRLNNAEKTLVRYLELLNAAKTIDEILRIEKEIERLNLRIETLKGRLEVLSHRVAFATITVNLIGDIKPGPIGYVFQGLYLGAKWLFVRE